MARRRTLRAVRGLVFFLLSAVNKKTVVNANGKCDESFEVRGIVEVGQHVLDIVLEPLIVSALELVVCIPAESRDDLSEFAGIVRC